MPSAIFYISSRKQSFQYFLKKFTWPDQSAKVNSIFNKAQLKCQEEYFIE